MWENGYLGDGNAGKEANDFWETIANLLSEENPERVIQPFDSKCLQLRFRNHIPNLIYTGLPIKAEEGTPLEVALVDASTGKVVKCGSEASAMVEILVIDKTFSKNDAEDWTFDEFKAKILAGTRGKTPLLGGNTCFNLIEGVGFVGKIFFRHTRYPLPKFELRLGARIIDFPVGSRIREATTELCIVKDRRGMNKKHYPLKMTDPVWRLENIGKNGPFHRKLSMENIKTVQHFLAEYIVDPQRLQKILGKRMPSEKLVATANHAQTCKRETKKLVDSSPMSQQNSDVEMGSFLEAEPASVKMFSDTQEISETAIPAKIWELAVLDVNDQLPKSKKADDSVMEISVLGGYDEDVIADNEASLMNASLCLSNGEYSSNSFMVSNPEGRNDSMYALFNQPGDILCPESAGAFCGDGYLGHIDDTDTLTGAFCEDEHQQFLNAFCPFQTTLSSPIDPPQKSVVANSEVKKKLVILFTASKWLLKIANMTAFQGNGSE